LSLSNFPDDSKTLPKKSHLVYYSSLDTNSLDSIDRNEFYKMWILRESIWSKCKAIYFSYASLREELRCFKQSNLKNIVLLSWEESACGRRHVCCWERNFAGIYLLLFYYYHCIWILSSYMFNIPFHRISIRGSYSKSSESCTYEPSRWFFY
jgi:hypothetical protein